MHVYKGIAVSSASDNHMVHAFHGNKRGLVLTLTKASLSETFDGRRIKVFGIEDS